MTRLGSGSLTTESTFVDLMRSIAINAAARGLSDDAAVLDFHGQDLILTHDVMAEGVHWLPTSDPADVAWKLLSVNLSDLAAKGAQPLGVLLGFALGDDYWDRRFAEGLKAALAHYGVSLLGGDTVRGNGPRTLGMTALGAATHSPVPSRSGAGAGDILWVTGLLGEALAGFECASKGEGGPKRLLAAYHRPMALLAEGKALASLVHAMMDVSDGLLLDGSRMAAASGIGINIDLAAIPLSDDYIALKGDDLESRIAAASWGDDYQLLFAGPADAKWPVAATAVGHFLEGEGLSLTHADAPVSLPDKLGYEHR